MTDPSRRDVPVRLVATSTVARLFGVAPKTVRIWVKRGRITPAAVKQVGTRRHYFFDLEELLRLTQDPASKGEPDGHSHETDG